VPNIPFHFLLNVINIIRFHTKILIIVLVTSFVASLQSAMRILQKMTEAVWFLDYTGGQSLSAQTYCYMFYEMN
jgi:hypothetical protein